MNNKDFFNKAIPVMLETEPCPDRDVVIKYVLERVDNMNKYNKKRKIGLHKKAVIIPVIIAAVLALTGAVIHEVFRIGFEENDLITELKIGRYYLETVDGFDIDCYIEVYGNNTLQFFGIEQKGDLGNGNYYDWNSAPVEYKIMDKIPFIAINDAQNTLGEGGADIGIEYRGENILWVNVMLDEHPDAKDYTPEEYRGTFVTNNTVRGHFVYEPMG